MGPASTHLPRSDAGRGSRGYLPGEARRLVHLARGCDTFHVRVGRLRLGKDLYLHLRGQSRGALAWLEEEGWPLPLGNRMAYALTAGMMGALRIRKRSPIR